MKVLENGERPKVGDEVEVVYRGKVTLAERFSSQFRVEAPPDSCQSDRIFSYDRVSEIRVTKPARNWVVGDLYYCGSNSGKISPIFLYRREAGGWYGLESEDTFNDDSTDISEGWLDKLIHLKREI